MGKIKSLWIREIFFNGLATIDNKNNSLQLFLLMVFINGRPQHLARLCPLKKTLAIILKVSPSNVSDFSNVAV
jgi:hypothetical protein